MVETGGNKRGRIPESICHRRRANGVCSNALKVSVAEMNEAVLQAIEAHALTPEAIEHVIQLSESEDVEDQRTGLERERRNVEKRIANITAAIEADGMGSLLRRLRELEDQLRDIDERLRSLHPIPRLEPSVIVGNRLAEWRRLLRASTTQSRTVLQRVLRGRITFTPTGDGAGYDFDTPTRFDKLFTGIVAPTPSWMAAEAAKGKPTRRSLEHIGPADTWDGDYGKLLENATVGRKSGKGKCARRDLNPRPTGSKPAALSN